MTTERRSHFDNGIMIDKGASMPPTVIPALTTGQIPVGVTGYPPAAASITTTVRAVPAVWVRVSASAPQAIPTDTETPLTCNTEVADTDAMHSTVTNTARLTCTVAGVYVIGGVVNWDASVLPATERFVAIRLNGATRLTGVYEHLVGAGAFLFQNPSTVYGLAVNDYVELTAYTFADGTRNAQATGFWAVRQGA